MGIKSKSRYVTKMDAILGDSLNADEGNTEPKALAERVIQEFKDRYPDFMRILNRQNKIKNSCQAPQWSKATLKKKADYREANKEKLAERDRKRALYEQYKLLPKGRRKKDFNIEHGCYGAGKCKQKPRYTKKELRGWEDQTKREKYQRGRKQRKELKGLTRVGRLAYFAKLRESWSPEELPHKKQRAQKSQPELMQADDGTNILHVLKK